MKWHVVFRLCLASDPTTCEDLQFYMRPIKDEQHCKTHAAPRLDQLFRGQVNYTLRGWTCVPPRRISL